VTAVTAPPKHPARSSGVAPSCRDLSSQRRRWLAALLASSLVVAAWQASFSRIPVGDATAYDGVAQVANHIRQAQPLGAIVYHHWLGWHYGFYLANAPVDLRFWESPTDLAAKASAGGETSQWIAFPAGRDQRGPRQALAAVGLRLQAELMVSHPDGTPSITLFRIVPSDRPTRRPATATAGLGGQEGLQSPARWWSPA
jgi:hypothetical protein